MNLQDLGREVRNARLEKNLTQANLARETNLSRETINLLENGLVRDLGIRKVLNVLGHLSLEMVIRARAGIAPPNFVRMACTTANVGFRSTLTEDQLIHALVTGKVPAHRSAHLRALFDEAPETLLTELVKEAGRWTKPGKLEKNLRTLIKTLAVSRKAEEWLTTV